MTSWVTIVWTSVAAACMTLAAVHLFVWWRGARREAHLVAALLAASLGAFVVTELAMMRAEHLESYLQAHRAGHVSIFAVLISIVFFIRSYFGVGRTWLLITIVVLRAVIVALTFVPGPTFNYRAVESLGSVRFLGESVATLQGTASPWARLGEFSVLLLLAYVADAVRQVARRADPARKKSAVLVGSSVFLSVALSIIYGFLLHTGRLEGPYILSLAFLLIIGVIGRELGLDAIRAIGLAAELRESNESMTLAASATRLALWRWDIPGDSIWVSPGGRELYGIRGSEPVGFDRFFATLHPDDREATAAGVREAFECDGKFHAIYRVPLADDLPRWIEVWGSTDFGAGRKPLRMRGVSLDITERRRGEMETLRLRDELAHAGRVNLLGQLSSSLAHELNQPLGAILRNAEAAALILDQPRPDLSEIGAILRDLHADGRRAGEVITRLRELLTHHRLEVRLERVAGLIDEVIALVRTGAAEKRVTLKSEIASPGLAVHGDRVHLLQVLLNLTVNAIDAISQSDPEVREIVISATGNAEHIEIRVRDSGPGLSREAMAWLFEPFHTTKPGGMGLGLSLSKTIIEAHGGRIAASNPAGGGAEFHLMLPADP